MEAAHSPDLSSVLSSCEPELQELMRQIDIMMSQQRTQWEAERRGLQLRVEDGEEELLGCKHMLERRDLEIGILHKQAEESQRSRQEVVAKYERELQRLREELDKLKRSYQKLQRRQSKQASGGAKESNHSKEHQQGSAEWEQLRARCQNTSPTQDASHIKSASWRAEPERGENVSEVQHLRTRLQKAHSSLPSQELELQRLRPAESPSARHQQLLSDQQEVLRTALDSPPTADMRTGPEQHKLQNEVTRLARDVHAKDQVIRSLEDCLLAQGCAGVENLRRDLERTAAKLQGAQACEAHLRAEVACLKQRLESMSRQQRNQARMEGELRTMKAECESLAAEIKKLSEELERARQTRSGEAEGTRREVSKLTGELHQRDLSIAALSADLSGTRQRLGAELQQAERKAAELKITQGHLETLQAENQHLKALLQKLQVGESSAALLRQPHMSSLGGFEENRQLRTAPAKKRPELDAPDEASQERKEQALISHAVTEPTQPDLERRHGENSGTSHEGEIHRLFKELQVLPKLTKEQPGSQSNDYTLHSSSSSSSLPSSSARLTRGNSAPTLTPHKSAAEGQSSSSDESLTSRSRERVIPSPSSEGTMSLSPELGAVARFLEEESMWSDELREKLDGHIKTMKENNLRTASKCLADVSEPESVPQQ